MPPEVGSLFTAPRAVEPPPTSPAPSAGHRSPKHPAHTRAPLPRRGEQSPPTHGRQEGNGPPAARIVAEVHHQRPPTDVLTRQKAPIAAVVRAVAVISHHEERIGWDHDRSPF